MLWRRKGLVTEIISENKQIQRLKLDLTNHQEILAVNYPALTGPCGLGDLVLVNGTADLLGLGSGGWDFVLTNLSRPTESEKKKDHHSGHLIKLRYTPLQFRVLAWDEEVSPHRPDDPSNYGKLAGCPVLIAGVHSLLEPTLRALYYLQPNSRIAYIMTDGASLPLAWSQSVTRLKDEGIITATISSGDAFGGDFEALNKFSALACGREAVKADYIVVSMGPGIPGTGTKYGSTSLEVGEWVNASACLGGRPIAIPRISTADKRDRHYGVSHHFVTALQDIALASAEIPFPFGDPIQRQLVERFAREAGFLSRESKHILSFLDISSLAKELEPWFHLFRSMGRSYQEDPLHFNAGMAAALLAFSTK